LWKYALANIERANQTVQELIDLAITATGRDDIGPGTRLVQDLGLVGDDMDEFLGKVIERYGTDFSNFRWHRHFPDEYTAPFLLIGRLFRRIFRLPQVEFDPITVSQLARAVALGHWEYGEPPPEKETHRVKPWAHPVAYGHAMAPMLLLMLAGALYSFLQGNAAWPLLFYALVGIVCLAPVAGLGLSIRLYVADPPHRAPTIFLIAVNSLFLALVLFVVGGTALGY